MAEIGRSRSGSREAFWTR